LDLRQWIEAGLPDTPATAETQHHGAPAAKYPLPCEPPAADALTGDGLNKLINGDQVYDFADGQATRLFMAKANFNREYEGQMVLIRQMDFLTIPEAEIQELLRAGLVKADRDLMTLH
jgi:hypothetical protein